MSTPLLAPVAKPSLLVRLALFLMRRQFGATVAEKLASSATAFAARMPASFLMFYGKVSRLDKKLELPGSAAMLIRQCVAGINTCEFCMDLNRWYATKLDGANVARYDALPYYKGSALFNESEKAALDYATQLTANHTVDPATFDRLRQHYSERQICEIVWLVASEHLYNITNIGLNIGSAGLCEIQPVPVAS